MKLQLKRSNVLEGSSAKEPTAVQMEYGELAVNYNNGDPAIFLKDNNDNIIRIAGSGSTGSGGNPSGPLPPGTGNQVGDLFFDTTNEILLYWNGSEWVPIASNETAADIFVGTLAEIDAEVPAADRRNGFLWWNTEDGSLYVWYKDGNTDQWVIANAGGGSGGGASVTISDTAPIPGESEDGDLWWDSSDGRLYIYYEDANSTQWVDASPDAQAPVVSSAPSPPTDPNEGDLWWNTTDGRLYIYYKDANSSQWVEASPQKDLSNTYVEKTGDTMTGTLTTPTVVIPATNGDATITENADGYAEISTADTSISLGTEFVTGFGNPEKYIEQKGAGVISPAIGYWEDETATGGASNLFSFKWQNLTGEQFFSVIVDYVAINHIVLGSNNIRLNWANPNITAVVDNVVNVPIGTASDYRLKENIAPLSGASDLVKQLKPCTFTMKETTFKGVEFEQAPSINHGFIAHELGEVIPEAEVGTKDDPDMLQSVNLSPVVSVLTKALQESITRIETLEAKVTSLEGGSN
jgi:hypothetical protein